MRKLILYSALLVTLFALPGCYKKSSPLNIIVGIPYTIITTTDLTDGNRKVDEDLFTKHPAYLQLEEEQHGALWSSSNGTDAVERYDFEWAYNDQFKTLTIDFKNVTEYPRWQAHSILQKLSGDHQTVMTNGSTLGDNTTIEFSDGDIKMKIAKK